MPRIPDQLRQHLLVAEAASKALRAEAKRTNIDLDFTLDGRFVGDVGELLAAQVYAVQLHKQQQSRHDGTCRCNDRDYGVQVKCRRTSDVIDFKTQPEILLVLEIDAVWEQWSVVYNGPGEVVTSGTDLAVDAEGNLLKNSVKTSRRLNLRNLRAAETKLGSRAESYVSVPFRT